MIYENSLLIDLDSGVPWLQRKSKPCSSGLCEDMALSFWQGEHMNLQLTVYRTPHFSDSLLERVMRKEENPASYPVKGLEGP